MRLFAITLVALVSVILGDIIGVPPDRQSLYEPFLDKKGNKKWRCLGHPDIVLDYSQINDDYCDCPDGSDEIGTNACPFNESNLFYCANQGHFPGYIENFKLNDGACDYDKCCDGSDEYLSNNCPSKCKEIHEQFINYKAKVTKDIVESANKKRTFLAKAKQLREETKTKLDMAILQKDKLIKQLAALEKQKNSSQTKKGPSLAFDILSGHFKALHDRATNTERSSKISNERLTKLEELLSNLVTKYNPNFNDAAVKEAVNGFQNYISNKDDDPLSDDLLSGLAELERISKKIEISGTQASFDYTTPNFSNMIHYYTTKLFKVFEEDQGVNISPPQDSDEVSIKLETTRKDLKRVDEAITALRLDLKLDYGENDILRSVYGKWVNTKLSGYNYKVGYLTTVYQDSNLLGTFSHYEDGVLYYTGGHKCWNGPHRLATVVMKCGLDSKILSVSEPEKCEYLLEITTPLGCKDITEEEIKRSFRIDYSQL